MCTQFFGFRGRGIRFLRTVACLILLICSANAKAQSFFYLISSFDSADSQSPTLYTFLTVQPDGTGTARLLYYAPVTHEKYLIELQLVDSLLPGTFSNDSIGFLIPTKSVLPLEGLDTTQYVKPVYVFRRITDSLGSYFAPSAMKLPKDSAQFVPLHVLLNRELSLDVLKNEKQFLQRFYNKEEDFYKFVTEPLFRDPVPIHREKLYLIFVANTNDSLIGTSSQRDMESVRFAMSQLANDEGITRIETTVISGSRFSKKAVEDAIARLRPRSSDIILFYYSGHGFRYEDDKSTYPRMSFRTKQNASVINNNLSVESVFDRLERKGARVTIVLSDCCNQDIGAAPRTGRRVLTTRGGLLAPIKHANVKSLLFPPERLSIIGSSTDINQLASGNPRLGGFFTYYFLGSLDRSVYTYSTFPVSWLTIFNETRQKAQRQALTALCGQSRCQQTAVFKKDPPF